MIKNLSKIKYELLLFFFLVALRLPALGYDTFNTDSWKWKARIYDFGSGVFGLDFVKTIQKYHPGVTLMWIGTLAIKTYNLVYDIFYKTTPLDNSIKTVFELNFVIKLFIVISISFTLVSIFYVLRNIFNLKYALLFTLLLTFEPFYTALVREIHLEGLMSTFMLASFSWLYYWLLDKSKRFRFILSFIFAGLAILTKSPAVFLIPFAVLVFIFNNYLNNKKVFIKTSLTESLIWVFGVVLIYFLLWPAMWVAPVQALQTVYRGIFTIGIERGHEQFYFGKLVLDPGPSFYLVVLALKSSIYLILGLVGCLLLYLKKLINIKKDFLIYVLLFSGLYFVEITIPSTKLDRYILPSMMALILLATFFYEWLFNLFSKSGKVFAALLIFPALITTYILHPDYFSYYNPIFGGLKNGINIIEPKWIIGQPQITDYFVKLKSAENLEDFKEGESLSSLINRNEIDNKLTVGFQEKYYTQIWPFIRRIGGWAVIEELRPEAIHTKYFVYPVWDDASRYENRFKIFYMDTIKIRNVPVYNVYKRVD